jgi:preprotein translocase subunit SecF
LLVVGVWLEGALVLREFGLALFIGLLVGAYSSIFVATPILAWWKEREPRYRALAERSTSRSMREMAMAGASASTSEAEVAPDAPREKAEKAGDTARRAPAPASSKDVPVIAPRPRQQKSRKRK